MAKAKKIKQEVEEKVIPPETETKSENTETVTVIVEEVKPEAKVEENPKPHIWNKRTGR